MDQIQSIKDTLVRIQDSQASAADALTQQVTIIAQEVSQWDADAVTPAQIANLQTALSGIAQTAEAQAQQIRDNSASIAGIVPDAPPVTPPA